MSSRNCYTRNNYVWLMIEVRPLGPGDAALVVDRIVKRLDDDATISQFVNPIGEKTLLLETLLLATRSTWIAEENGAIMGHLFAAVLEDSREPTTAWTGPDGFSYEDPGVLDRLLEGASPQWRRAHVERHAVWVLDVPERTAPWTERGYERFSIRGVMALVPKKVTSLSASMSLRAATRRDLGRILALDRVIDRAQGERSKAWSKNRRTTRREMLTLLEDPEVEHVLVESNHRVLAQAITFPQATQRGSFDHTLHLSEVAVDRAVQGRGIARAMLDEVLDRARVRGFDYVEAQWRVSNHQANSFWLNYGLTPTFVRLQHSLAE